MLNLIFGRAGTGKTASVMNEIKSRMGEGETGLLLIVPEQYSHDAERQLCAVCGDALSMHGETLSFSRLCGRVFLEAGAPAKLLDGGGQMLVAHRALESAAHGLKAFATKGPRAELLEKMLDALLEFKSLGMTPESLESLAEEAPYPLADKLRDLALIYGSYNALLQVHGGDSADRMALLADMIGASSIGGGGHVYFDGFNDFTAVELRVIGELFRKKAEITVSLTCDVEDESEVFELPRGTAQQLRRLAGEYGAEVRTVNMAAAPTAPELGFLEKNLFAFGDREYAGSCGAVRVYSAPSKYAECGYAAEKALELVRSGYRWRDIAVMARNWDEYGTICENVFEGRGIPFFSSGRADILSKPPVALIEAALEIAAGGWEYRPVFRYIKTGLTGVRPDDCSELENYVIKWNIRGSLWAREWTLPPPGAGADAGLCAERALARLNELRLGITAPLFRLRDGIKGISEAKAKLGALYAFFEDIGLPERLSSKAVGLQERGERRLAEEYAQLWGVVMAAMEQACAILGDEKLSAIEFRKVLSLVLSRYDVGVIPVSLDRTALGGMEMSRRRDLKCLILLGATDENMPTLSRGGGALSDSDREILRKLGADMPTGLEESLRREMNMLYSTLTLPSRELVVLYPSCGGARPSFIVKRLRKMFGLGETGLGEAGVGEATRSKQRAASMALTDGPPTQTDGPPTQTDGPPTQQCGSLCLSTRTASRNLSRATAERLFGRELSLSPSYVEKYYSCPFQYFSLSGLKLYPRVPAEFDAPAAGVFMHYVLEGVSREVKETVGFKNTDEELCRTLTRRRIEEYVRDALYGFEGKNARFVYLFRRLEEDAHRIALDMLGELKNSDFEPLDFELKLSDLGEAAAKTFDGLTLRGVVDRIDGWRDGGKLYIRVIDYKTGRKSFSLPDVVHGRDMQMLIYLFALGRHGAGRYGGEVAPSGVLYVPARDAILKAPRNVGEDALRKAREKELRRDGLILDDPAVIEAMENGGEKRYLPVKLTKESGVTGDSLVSGAQMGLLSKHVGNMLSAAASEILGGSIECRPYYKNENDNACLYCEYHSVCSFDEEAGDRRRFVRKMKPAEIWETLEKNN